MSRIAPPLSTAERIRSQILIGELSPGERISDSPEASLRELEEHGWLLRKDGRELAVTVLTRAEITQRLRVRERLEEMALELAIDLAPDRDLRRLAELAGSMEASALANARENFFEADREFHQALWRLSGNCMLPKLLNETLMPVLAFLFLRDLRSGGRLELEKSAAAHREIVEAMQQRDKENARQVARERFRLFATQHLSWYPSEG